MLDTNIPGLRLRPAEKNDAKLLLSLIKELAEYEKLLDDVETTEELLIENMFEKKHALASIAELDGEPVGYALYFFNFSTFLGRPGLYLEDIYIKPHLRGRGYGSEIFKALAKIALSENCGRMEWSCLDWNEPSKLFYKNMGAVMMDEWTVHRMDEQALKTLAES